MQSINRRNIKSLMASRRLVERKVCLNNACGRNFDNEPGNWYEQVLVAWPHIPELLRKGLIVNSHSRIFRCLACGQVAVGKVTVDGDDVVLVSLTAILPWRCDPYSQKFTRISR